MRLLSKRGAKIHPFEPQFSLQGASHGKSASSVCSNGVCEATDEADFLIGGGAIGGTRYEALIFRLRRRRQKNDQISTTQTDNSGGDDRGGDGGRGRCLISLRTVTVRTHVQKSRDMGIIGRDGQKFRLQGEGGILPCGSGGGNPPLWSGAHAQGIGEQDPKPHTPPPLGGDP